MKLTKSDVIMDEAFQLNVDTEETIVVQIPEQGQGVVLYTLLYSGECAQCFLPLDLKKRYECGLSIFEGV